MKNVKDLAEKTIRSRISPKNIKKLKTIFSKNFEVVNHKDDHTNFGLCWMHKIDDYYLCHAVDSIIFKNYKFLLKYNINNLISHSLGQSDDGRYWGWSHRALASFKVGDKIKLGDCAYYPNNKESFEESMIAWVSYDVGVDEEYGTTTSIKSIEKNIPNPDGYYTYHEKDGTDVTDAPQAISTLDEEPQHITNVLDEVYHEADQSILGINIITRVEFFGKQEGRDAYETKHWEAYPEKYGKGSYIIKTSGEAMQAAMDFASEVS